MRLTLKEIEARVQEVSARSVFDREFIFDLLLAYGRSKGNVTRLRSASASSFNIAADPASEVAQKNVLYFKELPCSAEEDLLAEVETLRASPLVVRHNTRFVIVTDYRTLLAKDIKTGETLSTPLGEIADHFTFFLPWAGMEKAEYTAEAHADIKAAERMAKLFDELLKLNPEANQTETNRHSLNIFFARLLFCFFAEDTGIFTEGQFSNAIASYTQTDGSDVDDFLNDLFLALDTEDSVDKPTHLADFPYVNGHLFTVKPNQVVPQFNKKARDYLIDSGRLIWSEINPDIFGSMFQAIVTPGQRSDLGQHYTSVPNILKTIEPLFLDELKEEFDASYDRERKLTQLLQRISQIKVFDPACGSGNFLVIAYKELRKLEHAILDRLAQLRGSQQVFDSVISIENFYGIEIDDFAVEVAILALWIAKHQMNIEFKQKFGATISLIPLQQMGQIKRANATRIDWNLICPNNGETEIYLIGNPPYKGGKSQPKEMKEDYPYVFGDRPYSKDLDYIALWFVKGAEYIRNTNAQLAFVSTNSVTQGEHVGLMFPMIFEMGLEIGYAYTSFKWENNARRNAGVTVVVINLRNRSNRPKYIFVDGISVEAQNINGYLTDAPSVYVYRRTRPISSFMPRMTLGSMPKDGGHLILEAHDRKKMIQEYPESNKYIKRYYGSAEFINDIERYCLWIEDGDLPHARNIPPIRERLHAVAQWRIQSTAISTAKYANFPNRFKQRAFKPTEAIIVPRVSSERRDYVPIGYLAEETVISDAANAVYDAEPWVFALLTSWMHMVWTRSVAGRMKTDYRYGAYIVYNNFPVPSLSAGIKEQLSDTALRVLDVREYHPELTLAELYDPDKMPENLRRAHQELDELVDSVYRKRPFDSDEDRLALLFDLYAKMSEQEAK